jgi:nucleotide-binding universal stress UspA family protein
MAWEYPTAHFLPVPTGGTVPSVDEMQASAEAAMGEALRGVSQSSDLLDPLVQRGLAETVLLGLAQNASLLVVGCRGLGPVKRMFLGSTSRHIVHEAGIPVAVIPRTERDVDRVGPRRIVVGVDDSDNARRALEWALEWARPEDRITAICAWSVAKGLGYDLPQYDTEHLRLGALRMATAAVEAAGGSGRVAAESAEGDPRSVLRHAGEEADLLVVGARGRSGLAYLAIGSTVTSLLADPRTSTVVVP